MTKFLGLAAFFAISLGGHQARAEHTFSEGTGGSWDCTQDAEVTINTSSSTYTLTGSCTSVSINGSDNKITVVRSTELSVNGAKNTVKVGAVDEVSVNGSGNAITYKDPAAAKKTSVTSNGKNAIKRDAKLVVAADAGATDGDLLTAGTIDCNKTKTVAITQSNTSTMLTGTCDKVTVTGKSNTVRIEATKNLTVTGAVNTIAVVKVDKIAATGAKNSITWNAGLTGKAPKIAATGQGNTVAKFDPTMGGTGVKAVGGTDAKAGDVVATKGTTDVSAPIDCNKEPSHTVGDNGGSYTFTGACDVIALNGNDITIKAESIKRLAIPGNHNTVDATTLGTISVSGNTNTVRYKKSAKVSNAGNQNTITQSK